MDDPLKTRHAKWGIDFQPPANIAVTPLEQRLKPVAYSQLLYSLTRWMTPGRGSLL